MTMATAPRVFYYVPDNKQPSWGIGMLLMHVRLLVKNGVNAIALHDRFPFRPWWFESDEPVEYLDQGTFRPAPDDILVVPEIVAARPWIREVRCRKFVFAQGSSIIVAGLKGHCGFAELGYERAIAIMPHVQRILEKHFDVPSDVIPPCIAPYFFAVGDCRDREKLVVLCPKEPSRDYDIAKAMLLRHLPRTKWELVELCGRTHQGVAEVLRRAAFHVSVNCQESFNAIVPESMAAGCVAVCYDAVGGQDYLEDQVNAYVFPNNHVFPLVERVIDLIGRFDDAAPELARIRANGLETAARYTEARLESALLNYFGRWGHAE